MRCPVCHADPEAFRDGDPCDACGGTGRVEAPVNRFIARRSAALLNDPEALRAFVARFCVVGRDSVRSA